MESMLGSAVLAEDLSQGASAVSPGWIGKDHWKGMTQRSSSGRCEVDLLNDLAVKEGEA
jgi:hypothetical protein